MTTRVVLTMLLALGLLGCRAADDQRTETVDVETMRQARDALDPEVLTRIDSGNAAYRRQEYEAALGHYREAARQDPDAAAAWFGVYMAELVLGNAEAAEDALRRARDAAPRATLVEPGTGEPPFTGPEAPAPAAPGQPGAADDTVAVDDTVGRP